jgi:hypothetical protein
MIFAYAGVPSGFDLTYDYALSGAAASLRDSLTETWESRQSLVSRRADEIVARLLSALQSASDDHDLLAMSEAIARAASVLRSIPDEYPLPEVVVEDDHEISLDWGDDVRRVLSVSVGGSPMLRYAALIGAEPTHGRVAFSGALPATLSFLLRRIYGGNRQRAAA